MRRREIFGRCHQSLFEPLEARMLLSATLLETGTLEIAGSEGDDIIIVQEGEVAGSVIVFGAPGVDAGTVFQGVLRLDIELLGGNDEARVDGNPLKPNGRPMPIVMRGGDGADAIESVTAPAKLIGGSGADKLFGSTARDRLIGGRGNDVLAGGGGRDRLFGGGGQDQLFGESGNDLLKGGTGNDQLRGGRGKDRLFGERGDDDLFGGFGSDQLTGGGGKDAFRGDFGEWQDRRRNDEFFSTRFRRDPTSATPPQTFWGVVNFVDTQFLDDTPAGLWDSVSDVQQFWVSSGVQIRRVSQELASLSQQDRAAVSQSLASVFTSFDNTFGGNPSGINAQVVGNLLGSIQNVLGGDVGQAFGGLIDSAQGEAMGSLVGAIRASVNSELPTEFTEALRGGVFGV